MPTGLATEIDLLDHEKQVRAIARHYQGRGLDVEDLVQAGMIGLMRAASRFDPDGTAKFSTYARKAIRGEIVNAVRDRGRLIRVPKNLHARVRAGETGGAVDDARRVLSGAFLGDHDFDGGLGLAGRVEDPCPDPTHAEAADLAAMVAELPEPGAAVIRGLHGLGGSDVRSHRELAEILGISEDQVKKIESDVCRTLRRRFDDLERPIPTPDAAPEEHPVMSNAHRANGLHPAPSTNGHGVAGRCPSCGGTHREGKRGRWCYNPACDLYRFKKGACDAIRSSAPVNGSNPRGASPDRFATALREAEVIALIMKALAELPPDSRGRVAAWVQGAL